MLSREALFFYQKKEVADKQVLKSGIIFFQSIFRQILEMMKYLHYSRKKLPIFVKIILKEVCKIFHTGC